MFNAPRTYLRIQLTTFFQSVWFIFTSQRICLYCVYEEFYSRLRQPKTLAPSQRLYKIVDIVTVTSPIGFGILAVAILAFFGARSGHIWTRGRSLNMYSPGKNEQLTTEVYFSTTERLNANTR